MGEFISSERVPVTIEDNPNTIYIKPRMDYGTLNKVQGAAVRVKIGQDGTPSDADLGAYNNALLVENVVGWKGPDFDEVECTPENMLKWDPRSPLLKEVLKQINDRNVSRAVTSPNSRTNGRSSTTKAKAEPAAP